jgi:hypothetical protein
VIALWLVGWAVVLALLEASSDRGDSGTTGHLVWPMQWKVRASRDDRTTTEGPRPVREDDP